MNHPAIAETRHQAREIGRIDPDRLACLLQDREELALIDVRETGAFARRHILYAVSVPLWRMEQLIRRKVPRQQARIVVTDDRGLLASEAARLLDRLGYSNIAILDGGIDAWERSGHEVFSGENVPSKAFGEIVEVEANTPHISARQLHDRIQAGEDLLIVDGRTPEEFFNFSIPGAYNLPNAELPYRIRELAPDPKTTVVVNCAGRTRSIIGAQTLIDAGVPNPIVSLQDGTMAWLLEGHALAHGKHAILPEPSPEHLRQAQDHARKLLERAGVSHVDGKTLGQWRNDADRSTFLFDIRTREEYRAGHLPGWRWAPGGQLIQATDEYIGTLGARIVIADWDGVRAATVAAWLVQLGRYDVHLHLPEQPAQLETGDERVYILRDPDTGPSAWISLEETVQKQARGDIVVIDVDSARLYAKTHISSACYVVAERIEHFAPQWLADGKTLVITSTDGVLADLVTRRLKARGLAARALLGGNRAWFEAGLPVESGAENNLSGEEYAWFNAYDHADISLRNQKFKEYLDWEVGLVAQLQRKGAEAPFTVLGARTVR
ncbi:MAG: hypothetical protein E2576_26740 [Alcaligenaceae bacterium]|nr:hypothetical protein [Alcaligenaceae bacterium SAGV5]MPS52581.1 hypothetical protein [Alcaligenaceae bacterium SAGV3]MPT60336.1 hypothetical protein [Alcaligenaceae bacterium]